MSYLPFISTITTLIFTGAVFSRFLEKRRTYLLFWSIGLLFYGLGTISEVILSFAFDKTILKLWYLSGAMLTAAWLGQGTVALLVRKRGVAPTLAAILLAVSLFSFELIRNVPITRAAAGYEIFQPISVQYKDILVRNAAIIVLTIILNIYGTFSLVGGALYSAWIFWRKRVLADRMYGNILIAAGALMPALGGTFTNVGLPDWLYTSELLGAILMYLGFLRATTSQKIPARKSLCSLGRHTT